MSEVEAHSEREIKLSHPGNDTLTVDNFTLPHLTYTHNLVLAFIRLPRAHKHAPLTYTHALHHLLDPLKLIIDQLEAIEFITSKRLVPRRFIILY